MGEGAVVRPEGAIGPSPIGPPGGVAETHSAWIVFLSERVYKLKKPVKLEFLDFSTRESREAAVHRELALNRRLAPDVYLGVADVRGPDGELCDHVLVMRRMPEERRLATLVRDGASLEEEITEIAKLVAAFHSRAETSPEIEVAGHPDTVRAKLERDLDELRAFTGDPLDVDVLDRVTSNAFDYLEGRTRLLEARVALGHIRDGHGDLLADDIFCLPDGPRILDCVEFDDRLRHGDVLADVAFLAMDLERLGVPALASRLLDRYRSFSSEAHPVTLEHYYLASRAIIRSKVACVRATQGDHAMRDGASALLALADRHLRDGRVRLVLVGGAPGTGKSTLAAAIAQRLGWTVLRSDELRKDLAGIDHTARAEAPPGEGIYDPATTRATYDALLERARTALELGEPVILDASWSQQRWREEAARVASATASELVELRCEVPEALAVARVEARRARGGDVSDATAEVTEAIREGFDSWPGAQTIRTDGSPDWSLDAALEVLDRR